MPRKNLLSLHEAIVLALISQPSRTASFEDIATFIEERNLYPERKGNIPLATQVMLRATKAKGAYHHLFEEIDDYTIRLKDLVSADAEKLKEENDELRKTVKRLKFEMGLNKVMLDYHEQNFTIAAANLLINPNPVKVHGTEKGTGSDYMIGIMDIIAIESKKRIKRIYLRKPVIPVEGGKPKFFIETNESFESLLRKVQGAGHHIIRACDKYAINIYHYSLSEKDRFTLIIEISGTLDQKLQSIETDKKFDKQLYHTRLMEIDRLNFPLQNFSINLRKIEEIRRYKNR